MLGFSFSLGSTFWWRGLLLYFAITFQPTNCGIVGLSKYLRTGYKNSWISDINKVGTIQVDHLCIDMNQVLHGCFRSTKSPDHIMAKIFIKLDDIFAKVSPHKSLVLAFDGPAPYAKVQTQRKRRKTHPECSLITPGTEFMNSMESVMICYILQRYRKHRLSNVAVFISDGTCPGEGELKIIDWIQHHMPRPISELSTADSILKQSFVQNNLLSSRDSVLICGSDSDILVQSICMGAVNPNTMVLQLTADGPDALCNISSLIVGLVHAAGVNWKELADYQVMATNNNNDGYPVEERLVVSEPASPTLPADTSARPEKQQQFHPILQLRSLHVDLAVLFALQGNDYLPKMRCISNQRALLAYSQAMRELPVAQRYLVDLQRNTFNFVALWALMKKLDEITNGMRMILPVVVPDAMAALHSALQKRAAKRTVRTAGSVAAPQGHSATKGITEAIDELTWNVTLVSGPAIRCLTTSNNEVEYFAELPVGAAVSPDDSSESATVRYFFANESASGVAYEAPQFDFTGLTLWRCSMHLNGVTYASLKLFASKRMARRHCAEMVLREIDEVHYLSYVQQRNAGKEALRRMKMTAAAERAGLDMAFGLEHAPTAGASSASEQEPEPDAQKRTCEDDPPRESIEESEKEKEVEMMTETGDVVDEEELNSTSEVSAQEYLAYLRDSDIEEFLRGVLWMVHMYAQGECSDQGYTYSSRPPLTALAIRRYIERAAERGARSTDGCSGNSGADTTTTTAAAGSSSSAARDADDNPLPSKAASSTQISAFQHLVTEQQRHLAARVSVPFSDSKSLSADAASLCVLPEEGVSFLPPRLRYCCVLFSSTYLNNSNSYGPFRISC